MRVLACLLNYKTADMTLQALDTLLPEIRAIEKSGGARVCIVDNDSKDGSLDAAEFRTGPHFGFAVPVGVAGIDASLLDPRSTWADGAAYDRQARKLVGMFADNFAKFETHVDSSVLGAAPRALLAAE